MKKEIEANEIPFTAKELAKVIELIDNGTISSAIAKKVIEELFENPKNPEDIIKEKDGYRFQMREQLKK